MAQEVNLFIRSAVTSPADPPGLFFVLNLPLILQPIINHALASHH